MRQTLVVPKLGAFSAPTPTYPPNRAARAAVKGAQRPTPAGG